MEERIASLRSAVLFGLQNGKTNMIVDLELLENILRQREELISACQTAKDSLENCLQALRDPEPPVPAHRRPEWGWR